MLITVIVVTNTPVCHTPDVFVQVHSETLENDSLASRPASQVKSKYRACYTGTSDRASAVKI